MSTYFAENELNKYLKIMLGNQKNNIDIRFVNENKDKFNDYYEIDISQGVGTIKGSNARSILLGVYDFLKSMGCVFLIPGIKNEVVPKVKINNVTSKKKVKPKYKYRTICLEGATSLEHIISMIDYLPKNGFNGYFIQFKNGHEFFERWYEHKNNSYLLKEDHTYEKSMAYTKKAIEEIKKRNLLFHSMGHGFTMEALGLESTGWQTYDIDSIDRDIRWMLAEINGVRKFYKNIPMNTQLCYSNNRVRAKLKELVVNYLSNNKHIDILHFWLADGYNNYCECNDCKKLLPSEYYVKLLNEIDYELTKQSIDTKIAFLAYYELLWPPKHEKLINNDRFILMFAPITRTYTKSYDEINYKKLTTNLEKFNLNKNIFPSDLAKNLSYIKAWKEVFKGDSFLFDYHLMWDGFKDYSNLKIANILHKDLEYLDSLGFDGFISCQLSRNFFPTALPMAIMGQTLVEKTDFNKIVKKTFTDLFGESEKEVLYILERYSDVLSHAYARKEIKIDDAGYLNKLLSNSSIRLENFKIINRLLMKENDDFIKRNLEVIKLFVDYVNRIYQIHIYKLQNDVELMEAELDLLLKEILSKEIDYSSYFDGFYLTFILKEFVNDRW